MIYKYCSPGNFSFQNLGSNSLHFRHYEDFNDPFEFWAEVSCGVPTFDEKDERFRQALTEWGFPNYRIHDLPVDVETLKQYFSGISDGEPLFEAVYDKARIACFSRDPENLLMWSHYADGLRGFCIEYDESAIVKGNEAIFIENVSYAPSPPNIDAFAYAVIEEQYYYALEHGYEEYEGETYRKRMNEITRLALATKPREWAYESEVRLIMHTEKNDRRAVDYLCPANSIKGVIVGERMSALNTARIKKATLKLENPVGLSRAIRDSGSYQIRIQDLAGDNPSRVSPDIF